MSNQSYLPHHILLRDEERTGCFRAAVEATVRSGDVVVDLGAGTGILSLFAARAGARKVFSIEVDRNLCEMIANLAADNGFSDVVEPVCGRSQDFNAPMAADVLLSDAMGFFGISEEIDAFFDMRDRVLKPDGRIIPQSIRLLAAPIESQDIYEWLDLGRSNQYGLKLDEAAHASIAGVYAVQVGPENLLADPVVVQQIDMRKATKSTLSFETLFRVKRAGVLHGLAGWYEATLADGSVLRSGPFTQRVMGRSRLFVSPKPKIVRSGDEIVFAVKASHSLSFWRQRINGSDWDAQTSLAAHPKWRVLSFCKSEWPPGLPDACLNAVQEGTFFLTEYNGAASDLKVLNHILAAAKRSSNAGIFTGL
jgi:protein arginine N-methyltransferase 1